MVELRRAGAQHGVDDRELDTQGTADLAVTQEREEVLQAERRATARVKELAAVTDQHGFHHSR